MIKVELPTFGDTMWVISPCNTVEQVKVQKVTYIETNCDRTVKVKTNAGEYRLYKLYSTKDMAETILKSRAKGEGE